MTDLTVLIDFADKYIRTELAASSILIANASTAKLLNLFRLLWFLLLQIKIHKPILSRYERCNAHALQHVS